MDDFRIEKIGILTLKIDPSLLDTEHPERWVRIMPSEEAVKGLKECDRFEIEVKSFDIAEDLRSNPDDYVE